MRSRKLIEAYKAVKYWYHGYSHAAWNRSRAVLLTDEQRRLILDAESLIDQAQAKLDLAFGPEIGKAMMAEVSHD